MLKNLMSLACLFMLAPDGGAGQEPNPANGQEPAANTSPKHFDEAYVTQLRIEAAKHRAEAQAAKTKLQEIEDAGKSPEARSTAQAKFLFDWNKTPPRNGANISFAPFFQSVVVMLARHERSGRAGEP